MSRYRVTATALNIRQGPGLDYPVVGKLLIGEIIEPVATVGWVPIKIDDDEIGWVASDYLKAIEDQDVAKPDFSTKEGTIAAIRAECFKQGLPLLQQQAYVLATADWETNHTFKPVREAYWLSEDWRRRNLPYYPYHGRGLVQLTHKANYERYSKVLGRDLVNNPDLALEPETACFVLVHGFKHGTFTGKRLEDYITRDRCDFINARRCINALDRAPEIAALARQYLEVEA